MAAFNTDLDYTLGGDHVGMDEVIDIVCRAVDSYDIHHDTSGDDLDDPFYDLDEATAILNSVDAFLESIGHYGVPFSDQADTLSRISDDGGDYLIAAGYFVDYCRETVVDCGYIPSDLPDWIVIDWEETARNMRHDFSDVTFCGYSFYMR